MMLNRTDERIDLLFSQAYRERIKFLIIQYNVNCRFLYIFLTNWKKFTSLPDLLTILFCWVFCFVFVLFMTEHWILSVYFCASVLMVVWPFFFIVLR